MFLKANIGIFKPTLRLKIKEKKIYCLSIRFLRI